MAALEQTAVTLLPFLPVHLELLSGWLRQPHVARWYPHPDENLAWAASPPGGGAQAIIACGSVEVGYLRWQHVDRDTLDSLGLFENTRAHRAFDKAGFHIARQYEEPRLGVCHLMQRHLR